MAILERWVLLVCLTLAAAMALYYAVLVPRVKSPSVQRGLKWLGVLPSFVLVTLAAAVVIYHAVLVPRIRVGKAQGQFLNQGSRQDVREFGFETASGIQTLATLRGNVVVVDVGRIRYQWLESRNRHPIVLTVNTDVRFYRDKNWFVILDSGGGKHKFSLIGSEAR